MKKASQDLRNKKGAAEGKTDGNDFINQGAKDKELMGIQVNYEAGQRKRMDENCKG